MNTQNVINKHNLSTDKAIDQYFLHVSISLLKKLRFETGHLDKLKMRNMLRLDKYVCGHYCLLKQEEKNKIREKTIVESILYLEEI